MRETQRHSYEVEGEKLEETQDWRDVERDDERRAKIEREKQRVEQEEQQRRREEEMAARDRDESNNYCLGIF